ncbi:MAG: NAD(P)-dependent oxidoreductase [Burkholderiaceae bacterium]
MNIAFIGLGRMGWPMAAHLSADAGQHALSVFDLDRQLGQRWQKENGGEHGGRLADSIADAVSNAQLILSSLPADDALLSVLAQAEDSIRAGAVWIDHSTTSARAAKEVADRLNRNQVDFIDAPVSGGVDGARAGTLTVMAGGEESAFERMKPVLEVYAARLTHMGASGAGQITKMTNQICVVGLCQALAEGLDFASRAGLDTDKVVQVMLQGSSASWQMRNRASQMLAGEYDFGFSTALMRKDIGLVLEEARAMSASLPVTALVDQFLADVDAMGGRQWDWCSLMERQRRFASD